MNKNISVKIDRAHSRSEALNQIIQVMIGTFRHFFTGDKPRKRLRDGGYLSLDDKIYSFYNVKNITIPTPWLVLPGGILKLVNRFSGRYGADQCFT